MIDIDITDIIRTQFKIDAADIRTAIPCTVTNVNNMGQLRVDVEPVVQERNKDGTPKKTTQILSVPVVMPGSANSLFSFPLEVGDTVLCIFSQLGMDNFKSGTGRPTIAADFRRHSDEDAIAIPGLFSFSRSTNMPGIRKFPHEPTQDLCIAHNIASGTEISIIMKQNGNVEVHTDFEILFKAGTKVNIEAPEMNINVAQTNWTGNITHSGNYTMTGVATFNGINFATHKHTGVTPGSGTSAGPIA